MDATGSAHARDRRGRPISTSAAPSRCRGARSSRGSSPWRRSCCGLLAWFKTLGASIRLVGLGRWIFEVVWALVGVAAVAGAMIGATWALRNAARRVSPVVRASRSAVPDAARGRHARGLARSSALGALLPARAHGPRHPMLVWSVTLPLWVGAGGRRRGVRAVGRLSVDAAAARRSASACSRCRRRTSRQCAPCRWSRSPSPAALWLFDTIDLLRFMVRSSAGCRSSRRSTSIRR